jgi:hypothetical protein
MKWLALRSGMCDCYEEEFEAELLATKEPEVVLAPLQVRSRKK